MIVRVSLSIPGKCVIRHMPSSRLRTAEAELQEASKREQVRTPGDVESARFFFFFSHRTHLVNLVNSVGFIGVFVSIHIHTKKFHWAKRGLKLKIMTGVLVYTSPKKRLDQNGGYIYISMEFFFYWDRPINPSTGVERYGGNRTQNPMVDHHFTQLFNEWPYVFFIHHFQRNPIL